jgi:flagellar hook-basal body complex protein FliE
MQLSEVKQRIDRVEQCADEAERAIQTGSVSSELRQSVDAMHQQARQAQQACDSQQQQQQQGDQSRLRDVVMQLEQAGDRAMQACRNAGNVDPRVQQAVQQAHDEASKLKKQLQMG